MRFDVISIFPEAFRPATQPLLRHGVVGRAIERGRIQVEAHDLRDHTHDRHRQVDDAPFGGGAGMVIKPEPVFEAVEALGPRGGTVVLLEPWGVPLDQSLAAELAQEPGLVIVCGRYEGIDDRVREGLGAREISVGGFVLSGGELPALVLIEAVARLLPGVLGDEASLTQDTFSGEGGYPQFTRPAEYRGMQVPEVLLSGNHKRIQDWRTHNARLPQTAEKMK